MPARLVLWFAPAAASNTALPGHGCARTLAAQLGLQLVHAHSTADLGLSAKDRQRGGGLGLPHLSSSPCLRGSNLSPPPAPDAVLIHLLSLNPCGPPPGLRFRTVPCQGGRLAADLELAQIAPRKGSQVIPEIRDNSPCTLGGPSMLSFEKRISILFTFLQLK